MDTKKILELHRLWVKDSQKGERANLWEANLRGADLRGTNLWEANLRGADLREANLRGANLRGANLRGTNLRGADLREADLRGTNLREADLRGTNLWGAKGGIQYFGFDKRGYVLISWNRSNEQWFNAGCHSFNATEAIAHWGSPDYPDQERGQKYVNMIKFILAELD